MAIRMESVPPRPFRNDVDVTIVWKGGRIARLLFPSGKVVFFDTDDESAAQAPRSPQVAEGGKAQ